MMVSQRVLSGIAVLLTLAVLAACGGGGGGGAAGGGGKDWGTASLIETDNAGNAGDPQMAFDNNGNALAVWAQSDGTRNNIWANHYTAGTGWGTAAQIETDTGNATQAQIAIDANGNALAVWTQFDGTRNSIWANRFIAGTGAGAGWGTAALIETDNAGDAYSPQIAIDANGNALAVWYQSDGTRYSIVANHYTAGTGWGTTAVIETDNAGNAIYPQIAIATNGDALAVWAQYDGTRFNIVSNRFIAGTGAGTGWGTAALIETGNAGDANMTQIAIDASGNALAVWSQFDGTRDSIWANRFIAGTGAGTGWGTASLMENDNVGNAYSPQIAIDASGNALAVWYQSDGSRNNIMANRYTAGTGWGTASLIETNNTGSAYSPQISMDANGNALAVWTHFDGTRDSIWANRFIAGTGAGTSWGAASLIETDNAGDAYAPQIAIDANGNALAMWHQSDGTRFNIWANRYQ